MPISRTMDRADFERWITEVYSVDPEHPWAKYPDYSVFRHGNNQKWFALVMTVPKEKLGLDQPGMLDIVNVKCDPMMLGSALAEPGFYPGYHMSKGSWVSVALDGSVSEEQLKILVDLSYDLTGPKRKKLKKIARRII